MVSTSDGSGGRATCINLKQHFGGRYRVQYEESYYVERPEFRAVGGPWLTMIPCQNGHIFPWGGSTVAACTNTRGRVATKLKKTASCKVAQDGDDGVTVLFDVEDFEAVAEIMKPRKRRRLSEEQKQKAVERLRPYWSTKGQKFGKS